MTRLSDAAAAAATALQVIKTNSPLDTQRSWRASHLTTVPCTAEQSLYCMLEGMATGTCTVVSEDDAKQRGNGEGC